MRGLSKPPHCLPLAPAARLPASVVAGNRRSWPLALAGAVRVEAAACEALHACRC
jgi:hypothetical protein